MNSLPQAFRIRHMTPVDLDRVMEIAASLKDAPQWPRSAYLAALEAESAPRRIALVVEIPSVAKAQDFLEPETARLKSCPDASGLLSDLSLTITDSLTTSPDFPTPRADSSVAFSDSSAPCADFPSICADDGVGVIAGFAVASLLPPEAELELIGVDPAAQRRGLARLLFAELAAELRAAQVNEMILEVRASNLAALALYQNLGFVESGRRKDYYQIPVEDALLMRLFF